MSKLGELLTEIAEQEDLSEEEIAAVAEVIKRRRERGQSLARVEPAQQIDFPAGPNEAARLARRDRDADVDLAHPAHERGVRMYGRENASEAYARWMDQEQSDPEGVYGPGGASAGGIFGDAPIAMADYDPTAHRRSDERMSAGATARLTRVLEVLLDRLDGPQAPRGALSGGSSRRLPGKR